MSYQSFQTEALQSLLEKALAFRQPLLSTLGPSPALRLFNGFWEGWPGLAVELYDRTLVILLYEEVTALPEEISRFCLDFYLTRMGEALDCVVLKNRGSDDRNQRQGVLLHGSQPASQVQEFGVTYALNLQMHQDTSLYLDTRSLREWALHNLAGASVLNTFAYTGSLGAAAVAGGARSTLQTDKSSEFLALARQTYQLNGWQSPKKEFIAGDFFSVAANLKSQNRLFDCVFIDPPFFSVTPKGRVDLLSEYSRLINKVRPLIGHGGSLVAVNNAVFLPGEAYMSMLQELCAGGYMQIESTIPAPSDFTGFMESPPLPLPADPAPFNHTTKIAVLRVQRKDERTAQ